MSTFTDPDAAQDVKAAVHGAVMTLAAMCGIYNGCAYLRRPARHLAANVLVYTALVIFEGYQMRCHCR